MNKFVQSRALGDPNAAARKLMELAKPLSRRAVSRCGTAAFTSRRSEMELLKAFVPEVSALIGCLKEKASELSPACSAAFKSIE